MAERAPDLSARMLKRFRDAFLDAEEIRSSNWNDARREDLGGVLPLCRVHPKTEMQLVDVLRLCELEQCALLPVGGATALCVGEPPTREPVLVDMSAFDQVVEYSPEDFVVKVQAGCKLEKLQERLHAERQWLSIEPPDSTRATIGGMIGAASTSLVAHAHGTLRNHLLGTRVMHQDTRTSRAGGKVVKNVAGYDLMKLYHGSLGTLAIVLEATLRLRPLPEKDVLLECSLPESRSLLELRRLLLGNELALTAAHLLCNSSDPSKSTLLTRMQGAAVSVDAQTSFVRQRLQGLHEHVLSTGVRSSRPPALLNLEQTLSRNDSPSLLQLSLHFVPSAAERVMKSLYGALHSAPCRGDIALDLLRGLCWVKVPELSRAEMEGWMELLRRLDGELRQGDAVLTVQCSPPWLRNVLSYSRRISKPALEMSRRIKQQLDPRNLLAPGRLDLRDA